MLPREYVAQYFSDIHERTFTGAAIADVRSIGLYLSRCLLAQWVMRNVGGVVQGDEIGQALLDCGVLLAIDASSEFSNSDGALYQVGLSALSLMD